VTSPTDQITYRFRTDERDAVRGLRNIRDGMQDVDRLGKTLAKTQRTEADAAGRLRVAQAKLADVRKTGKANASRLAAAEESVAKAQRGLVASAGEARSASLQLAKAQERAGDSADRTGRKLRGLHRSAEDSSRSFASVRKNVGGFSLGIGRMLGPLGLAVGATTAVGGGLLALGLNAYKGAANLQLMDQKSRIVFGKSFPELNKWAGKVANSFGLTRRELLSMTVGFADMLVPMGLTRTQAAKMSQQFARMAPILSAWSGGTFDTAQAAEALTGALTGEYDTLQRLGIPISDALVQGEALRLGLVKRTVDNDKLAIAQQRASLAQTRYNAAVKEHGPSSEEARRASLALQVATQGVEKAAAGSNMEISAAAKAQAALSLIMKGSTDAQRAFASSQDTLAVKANKARARFGELRDEILVALIPAFDKLGSWFLAHQDDIISFGFKAARGMIDFGEAAALAFAGILDGLGDTMVGFGDFLSASNTTWAGVLQGARLTLGAVFPGLRKNLDNAVREFETFRREAGNSLVDAGNKAKGMADKIRTNVPPAADLARRKLEDVRRAALGLPPNPKVTVTTPGADTAVSKMNLVTRAANNIPERRVISVIAQISARDVTASITARNVTGSGAGRAFGGFVPGHSAGDRSDNVDIRATAGEYVVQRPTVRKLERTIPGFLDRLNAGQLDIGGDPDVMRIGVGRPVRGQKPQGYALGGRIAEAQRYIKAQFGEDYIWGGSGPFGGDCSGYVGNAYNILTGRPVNSRAFTTATIGGAQGFRPGRGTFTVGVTRGAGHMAGNLAGLAFEATPPRLRGGAAAAPVTSFARQFYLPSAGGVFGGMPGLSGVQMRSVVRQIGPAVVKQIVRELGIRRVSADSGAVLAPRSSTIVDNGTNSWEQVGPPGAGGRPINVTVNNAPDKPTRRAVYDALDRLFVMHPGLS
jgi:hypothetical protein